MKLKAKWLVVACAPFPLHFCPQGRWSRQINWITCVLWTETVTNHCYVNRQINMSYYQQVSNCCRPVLTYWPTDWWHQWLTDCWSCMAFCCDSFSLLWQLCTVGHWIFLYGRCKQLSVGELHTHTCLMALCPGLPRWAGTRKVKPIWILLKQETVSGSGISWTICKSAPRSRVQTDNHISTPPLKFFYRPDALPAAQPTASKHWRHTLGHPVHTCPSPFQFADAYGDTDLETNKGLSCRLLVLEVNKCTELVRQWSHTCYCTVPDTNSNTAVWTSSPSVCATVHKANDTR